jgi:L-arabinose isomerase
MSALNPYLTLPQSFHDVFTWTTQQLKKFGLQVEQTFDLQVARVSHVGCTCPHHGTEQCSCQMVVLLIRGESKDPLTLILHGNDGHTNLSIVNLTGRRFNPNLDAIIRLALVPQNMASV